MTMIVSGLGGLAAPLDAGGRKPSTGGADAASFSSRLGAMGTQAIARIDHAEQASAAGLLGMMPVQDVVEQVMAAERTLTATLAIRDKIVGAYLELSRMQI